MPFCRVITVTAADGGDGTADAYLDNSGGEKRFVTVKGPNWQTLETYFAMLADGTAVIEMAKASGIVIAESGTNPLYTTTYGTGELIKAALDAGSRRLIIGIGGSATNDGGAGMAAALGVRFLDGEGNELEPVGGKLDKIQRVDVSGLDGRIAETEILVACDVENTLCGENGSAEVFARQKGASDADVKRLDENLHHLATVVYRDTGKDMLTLVGGGAAGGLGAGLVAFLGARLTDGATLLLDAARFENQAADADFIVTGEGCFDRQSLFGKLPVAIAARAGGKPTAIIAGKVLLDGADTAAFFSVEQSAADGVPFEEVKKTCKDDLLAAAKRTARAYLRYING